LKQVLNLVDQEDEDVPWESLFFLTAQINYGGRVTDDIDRRLLVTTLEKFMGAHTIDDSYKYSPSGIYYPPKDGKI